MLAAATPRNDGVRWAAAGARKLAAIRENGNFFRRGLQAIGCEVLGDEDSPIIPIMLFNPTKIAAFSRECLKRGVRAVCVRAACVCACVRACCVCACVRACARACVVAPWVSRRCVDSVSATVCGALPPCRLVCVQLAVVVVGFPATPLVTSRARFCISAGHKHEDLVDALEKIKEVARVLRIRYATHTFG